MIENNSESSIDIYTLSSVQSLSRMNRSTQGLPSITNSRSPPKTMSIESVTPPTISSSVVPFSSCPQSFPASGSFPVSQLFTSGGQIIGVISFSISPSNEHPGLISLRMDWLDFLAVQGTLRSLLQHHSCHPWGLVALRLRTTDRPGCVRTQEAALALALARKLLIMGL